MLEFHAAVLTAAERSKSGRWQDIDIQGLADTTVRLTLPKAQHLGPSAGARPKSTAYRFQSNKTFRNSSLSNQGNQANTNTDRVPNRYFCSAYNQGVCSHQGSHWGVVGGRSRLLEHFCASCKLAGRGIRLHNEKFECEFQSAKPTEAVPVHNTGM